MELLGGASSGTLGKAWIVHRVHPPPAPCLAPARLSGFVGSGERYPLSRQAPGLPGALAPAAPTAPSACILPRYIVIVPKNTSYLVVLLSTGYVKYSVGKVLVWNN